MLHLERCLPFGPAGVKNLSFVTRSVQDGVSCASFLNVRGSDTRRLSRVCVCVSRSILSLQLLARTLSDTQVYLRRGSSIVLTLPIFHNITAYSTRRYFITFRRGVGSARTRRAFEYFFQRGRSPSVLDCWDTENRVGEKDAATSR